MIIGDIANISSVYFPNEEIVDFDELKSCPAFTYKFEGFNEVRQGYINDKDLYFEERPDFKELINNINNHLLA
jgi:hypothetical protein